MDWLVIYLSTVRGVYPYQAGGPDELSVQEGGLIELTSGPNGGMNYADGWWEGASAQSCDRGERYEHAARL